MTINITILLIILLININNIYASNVNLTLLSETKHDTARCMDGTMAGYYYEKASNINEDKKWVIYLYGGGECDNEESCKSQLNTELGSSNYFADSYSDTSSWYLASGYCPYNPSLCGFNHVGVPYCSQDLHSGQITTKSDDTWGLYFAGHLILSSILDELDELYNLKDATDIILTGVSAGGIGVWMNIDFIANRYPNTRVTAATIAGFYFYETYYNGTNHTNPGGMADFRKDGIENAYKLYNAYVDETCKIEYESYNLDPAACMLSNNSFPFIESDSYVIQAQTDQVVLTGHDCFPQDYMFEDEEQSFMYEFSSNMSNALAPLTKNNKIINNKPQTGIFSVACYIHGSFTHTYPLLNGYSYNEAFTNFYFNYSIIDQTNFILQDNCGIMCNPTCPSR
jgi:ribosome maturation protein SDO1